MFKIVETRSNYFGIIQNFQPRESREMRIKWETFSQNSSILNQFRWKKNYIII